MTEAEPMTSTDAVRMWELDQMSLPERAPAPDKAGDREGVAQMRRALLIDDAFQRLGYTQKAVAWLAEMGVEVPCVPPYGNDLATFQKAERLAALSTGNEELGREGVQADARDDVLFAFHRYAKDLDPAEVTWWTRHFPQFAGDIREHAVELIDMRFRAAAPTLPVSPKPDSRAGAERDDVKHLDPELWAAFDKSIAEGIAHWMQEDGYEGLASPSDISQGIASDCLASVLTSRAAIQSAPTASAAAGPVGEDSGARAAFEKHYGRGFDLERASWGDGYARDGIDAMWKGWRECWNSTTTTTPTPAPHPVPAKEGR